MDCCENQIAAGRVVCPKPRRLGPSNFNNSMTPLRFHTRNSAEALDSKFGAGLLDTSLYKIPCCALGEPLDHTHTCMILIQQLPYCTALDREGFEAGGCVTISSSSPPFFYGSPPCRAQNPLIQDDEFRVQKHGSTVSSPSDSSLVPSAHNRVKFGYKQADVRVEGFDCQSSRVVAMA